VDTDIPGGEPRRTGLWPSLVLAALLPFGADAAARRWPENLAKASAR